MLNAWSSSVFQILFLYTLSGFLTSFSRFCRTRDMNVRISCTRNYTVYPLVCMWLQHHWQQRIFSWQANYFQISRIDIFQLKYSRKYATKHQWMFFWTLCSYVHHVQTRHHCLEKLCYTEKYRNKIAFSWILYRSDYMKQFNIEYQQRAAIITMISTILNY